MEGIAQDAEHALHCGACWRHQEHTGRQLRPSWELHRVFSPPQRHCSAPLSLGEPLLAAARPTAGLGPLAAAGLVASRGGAAAVLFQKLASLPLGGAAVGAATPPIPRPADAGAAAASRRPPAASPPPAFRGHCALNRLGAVSHSFTWGTDVPASGLTGAQMMERTRTGGACVKR